MAVKVILKPGGIALLSLGVVAIGAQSFLTSRNHSSTAAAATPPKATSTPTPALSEDQFWGSSEKKDEKPLVVDTDPAVPSGTGRVAHVKVSAPQAEGWQLQAGVGIPTLQKPGDQRSLSFWAKTDAPEAEVLVAVEYNYAPFEKFKLETVKLTSQWKEYRIPVTFTKEVPVGKGNITFQVGKASKDCYFSAVRL